jgi:NAD-dependent deacetylase
LNYAPENAEIYLIDPKPVSINSYRNVHFIQKGGSEGVAELQKLLIETK